MNNIILDALDYFFDKGINKGINDNINVQNTDEMVGTMPVMIINGVKKKYNILGTIHNDHFYWAWYINIPKYKYTKSKQLLSYATNKEVCTLQDTYIKRLLLTPVHNINNDENVLTIILALALYLTKAHHFIVHSGKDIIGLYDIDS